MKLWRACAAVGFVAAISLTPTVPSAAATDTGERITNFQSEISVDANGSARVVETIDYDLGPNPKHGIYRYLPVRFDWNGAVPSGLDASAPIYRLTPLSNVSVQADRGSSSWKQSSQEGVEVLQIGDAGVTLSGQVRYTISYTLAGVMNSFEDSDELYLNVTGNGWTVPIESVSARITMPGRISRVGCAAGPTGSTAPCSSASQTSEPVAALSQGRLAAGSGLTAIVAVPKGVVSDPKTTMILEQGWSLKRAFTLSWSTAVLSLAALTGGVGAIARAAWRTGRDRQYMGSPTDQAFGNDGGEDALVPLRDDTPVVVEFVPPEGIRPGHMGTLWDEQANHLDVSAMIVDLAVRGWLRIDELEPQGLSRKWGVGTPDYRFVCLRDPNVAYPADPLYEAERVLLSALFRDGGEAVLSELKTQFASRLEAVQSALYVDSVQLGWFADRPDRVRTRWLMRGVAIVAVGAVMLYLAARYTSWGLVVAAIPMVGLVLMAVSPKFPRRTAHGTALLGRVRGFREIFDAGEGERQHFAEDRGLFTIYLPYAMVFGCTEKWAQTFASLGLTPQEMGLGVWYTSPYGYGPMDFGWAMGNFVTSSTGSLAAAAPSSAGGAASGSSGFGGGFSGGGFGGGGGGSW